MAKPKRQDVLYSFIKRSVRNALDLEYAIRASDLISHDEMASLRRLEFNLVQFWVELGASEKEVQKENLLDFAWDTLQVGFPLTRRHDRVFHPELLEVIREGLSKIRDAFSTELHLLAIPAANFYRVCDLLAGSDIPAAITQVQDGLKASSKYEKYDDVPLGKFGIRMREPIHLHPAFRYGMREESGKTVFGFEVDLAGQFDLFAWRRQFNEFQYQYALYRSSLSTTHDKTTRDLIHKFLSVENEGDQSEFDVPGLDSFLPLLTGLYCWDRYKREHETLTKALTEALKFYPTGEDNMRRNYRIAAKRIEDAAARFKKAQATVATRRG